MPDRIRDEHPPGCSPSSVHPVVARILARRGIPSGEAASSFLSPVLSSMEDPFKLSGMSAAVSRLLAARAAKEKICVYGDYDVDGITATALAVSCLRALGFDCGYFIPHRIDDGYGLSLEALRQIADTGAKVVLTVDCGITAVKEAEFCRSTSIALIITDHHTPPVGLPDACAIINPHLPGCPYPFKGLAGVGVAFNLLAALRFAMREAGVFNAFPEPDLREYLDLVALGTIADVVPLVGQNRLYVSYGLRLMERAERQGIRSLKRSAGINGEVTSGAAAFRLAPRLNAAGRLESAVPGVDLLLSADPGECDRISAELSSMNSARQDIERSILEDAIRMVESEGGVSGSCTIVLASEEWHQGVVGIVASRIVERYHRPAVLIAVDESGNAKGSGRSIPAFHLLDAISACSGHLARFGGHRYAAGISLSAGRIKDFAEAFEAVAATLLVPDDLVPRLEIDAVISPHEANPSLVRALSMLAPFGAGNPEPVLVMRNLKVLDSRRLKGEHLRLRLSADGSHFNAIGFGMAERNFGSCVDIAFSPEMNEWNGNAVFQLKLKDIREAQPFAA